MKQTAGRGPAAGWGCSPGLGGHGGGLTAVAGTAQTAQAETASGESTVYHTVRRGDTLWGIAKRYGVTLRSLIAANPQIKNPNLIYPGEQVRVK